MTIQLSEHFNLMEMCNSQTAARRNIDNYPKDTQTIENLKLLCTHILEPVRSHFGVPFSPTSGFRCKVLNRAIGGVDNSQHQYGEAADFVVPSVPLLTVYKYIAANLEYDQLILEYYKPGISGWVHCSYAKGKNRKKAFKIG